jgi:histidinol-phosphate phosphatase family domain/HAD-superfamily hydrolase, subfamily IIIA
VLRDALILDNWLDHRLGEPWRTKPKSMVSVADAPLLEHLVWNLWRHGIRRVRFSVGCSAAVVRQHFGDGSRFGVEATYASKEDELGSGGALRIAAPDMGCDEFLVLDSDTLFDCNYHILGLVLDEPDVLAALALGTTDVVARYGRVGIVSDRVTGFEEKHVSTVDDLVKGGVCAVRAEVAALLPPGVSSLERDLFPRLAADGRLAEVPCSGHFTDHGRRDSLRKTVETGYSFRRRPAVFLDRDGVLNEDRGWVHTAEKWRWMPGAREAVRWLNDAGYLVVVVTNQAGIGRGYYTQHEFDTFTRWIDERLAERGAHVDAWYHCPHHPTEAIGDLRVACACRKPKPGMLLEAIGDWEIDIEDSVMVGDADKDLEAAAAAGVRAVRYSGGDLLRAVKAAVRR